MVVRFLPQRRRSKVSRLHLSAHSTNMSPSSRKRPRSPSSTLPTQPSYTPSQPSSQQHTEFHLSESELPPFRPGCILRIALRNFMTYDDVELRPGPGLNLVLGPNGTGKSSIVSAICVGLGGNPKILGRASKVRDYVKHGREKAWTEIDIMSHKMKPLTIMRIFKAKGGTSGSWKINGKAAKTSDVEELTASYNIQLDNLTQFLPQDKVSSFAAMGPVELLQSTQKAVLKPEIIEKQQELIKKQETFLQSSTTVSNLQQRIAQLKKQNEAIERDVELYLERQKHLDKAEQLRVRESFMEFSAMQVEGKKTVETRRHAQQRVEEIKKQFEPTRAKIADLKSQQQDLDHQMYQTSASLKKHKLQIEKYNKGIEKLSSRCMQLQNQIDSIDNRERDREKNRQNYRRQIDQMQEKLNSASNVDKMNQQLETIQQKEDAISAKRGEYMDQKNQHEEKLRSMYEELQKSKHSLQRVQQHDQRILSNVRNNNHAAYDMYQWVARHKDQFEVPNEVFFVPLAVNIKNPLHAKFFEASVAQNYQYGFVTTSSYDRDLIQNQIKDRGFTLTVLRVGNPSSNNSRRYSDEQLKSFGLTGYLDSVIEAPPQVRQALCDVSGINTVLFSERANLQVETIGENLPMARTVFEPDVRHYIAHSRYSGGTSIRSDALRFPARLFTGIDRAKAESLQQKFQQLTADYDSTKALVEDINGKLHNLGVKSEEYRNQSREIRSYFHNIKRWESSIQRYQRELERLNAEEDTETTKAKYQKDIQELNRKRIRIVELIRDELTAMFEVDFSTDIYPVLKSKLKDDELNITSEMGQFEEQLKQANAEVHRLQRYFDDIRNNLKDLKVKAVKMRDTYIEKHDIDDEKMREILNGLSDDLHTIREQIVVEEAAAASIMDNQNIIREYETRKRDIAVAEKELEEFSKKNSTIEAVIKQIEDEWATPLRECIKKLNRTFQEYTRNFGIAGEVNLNPHPSDYSKWEIQIKVKFRDNEPLAVLSKSRQSGGERSVTTILYLLALQVINNSPFRVVDEINQGMDPINERKIFHQMLRSCSGKDVPQSFLITPKLLPNLVPPDANNITVLFIFNGAFGLTSKDLKKYLKAADMED